MGARGLPVLLLISGCGLSTLSLSVADHNFQMSAHYLRLIPSYSSLVQPNTTRRKVPERSTSKRS